ncbi:unnamed protein product [Alternaria alternata]
MGKKQNYHLYESQLNSEININKSVLATRGWAAQERILAPRVIHYTTRQMIWECAQAFWCEASHEEVHRQILGAGRATRFDPKLIGQHIVLQDERNVYGAVQEGSYITIECACLMNADFDCVMKNLYGDYLGDFSGVKITLDWGYRLDVPAPYDYCMFLNGNLFYKRGKWREGCHMTSVCMDVLLLSWVDQEAKVAQRVGVAKIQDRGNRERLLREIKAANWERWTLKLV